jgi:hypothetical protein
MFMQGKLTDLGPGQGRWLSFEVDPLSSFSNIELRPAGWHLGWLAAWIALVAVAGVARHGASRRLGAVALGVAVVAAVTGFAQTRPVSAEQADAMADYIDRPPPTRPAGSRPASATAPTTTSGRALPTGARRSRAS